MKKIILVSLMFFLVTLTGKANEFDLNCTRRDISSNCTLCKDGYKLENGKCIIELSFSSNRTNSFLNLLTPTSTTSTSTTASSGDKEEMDEVIRLKTQVLARELNRQYKYLETTVNRFQMQLQKAIAKDNADFQEEYADSGSSSSESDDKFNASSFNPSCSGRTTEAIANCFFDKIDELSPYVPSSSKKIPSKVKTAMKSLCNNIVNYTDDKEICGTSCGTLDQTCLSQMSYALTNKVEASKKQSAGGQK